MFMKVKNFTTHDRSRLDQLTGRLHPRGAVARGGQRGAAVRATGHTGAAGILAGRVQRGGPELPGYPRCSLS